MVVNPAGPVLIFDGGTPRIITARNPIGVTGGQLIFLASGSDVVSSGLSSFVTNDLVLSGLASGASFNGVVLTAGNTASGTSSYVSVGLAGLYILTCGSDVLGGKAVESIGADSVMRLGSHAVPGGADDSKGAGRKVGRAITSGFSGTSQFAIIQLTP